MSALDHQILDEVLATAKRTADESARALERALEIPVVFSVIGGGRMTGQAYADRFSGPGLVLVVGAEGAAAMIVMSQSSGLLPSWCSRMDHHHQNRRTALAQELGMLMLPDDIVPTRFHACRVGDLGSILGAAGVDGRATWLLAELKTPRGNGHLAMIWPVSSWLLTVPAAWSPPRSTVPAGSCRTMEGAGSALSALRGLQTGDPAVSPFFRNLLKLKIPVTATVATGKKHIPWIMQLRRGSLIRFDQPSQPTVTLHVAQLTLAEGEAVKAGDHYGVRITGIHPLQQR